MLTFFALLLSACSVLKDELVYYKTYSFKFPVFTGLECDGDYNNQNRKLSVYPAFTQRVVYKGVLSDTIKIANANRGAFHQNFYTREWLPEIHVDTFGLHCYPIPYSQNGDTIMSQQLLVYLFNPGPGLRYYPLWDGNITTGLQMYIDDTWIYVDMYTAPCATMFLNYLLEPNEIVVIAIPAVDGNDMVKSRITLGDQVYSDEFVTSVNLDSLYHRLPRWQAVR